MRRRRHCSTRPEGCISFGSQTVILAGDIGGTKCNFGLAELRGSHFEILVREHYLSRDYSDFTSVLDNFLRDAKDAIAGSPARKVLAAGFSVAGPVIAGSAHLTNLGWNLDHSAIVQQLGTPYAKALLNDLEATGYALPWLGPEELATLNEGQAAPQAACALLAAGTGLGEGDPALEWNALRR